ncbi:hypothetical protein ZIOFF_047343 [Zingiber officinale]|uniref:Amine oxidase n=1 Tax=Zingiber officinale TaxID=94328 RepID=A0A8J5KTL9_ZINOF|nr:hypothetical protein ZIOFF_047343 [Zingiber officinale]
MALNFLLFLRLVLTPVSAAGHPLDPLTADELTRAIDLIRASPLNSSSSLAFHYVGLDEPPKPAVLAWPRSAPPRRAFIIARAGGATHEIHVDLSSDGGGLILSETVYRGAGFPTFTIDEQVAASKLPFQYPPFEASVARRGIPLSDVLCTTFSVGWFGGEERWAGRRVIVVQCFVAAGTANFYARPVEGVHKGCLQEKMPLGDMMKLRRKLQRHRVPSASSGGTEGKKKLLPSLAFRLAGAKVGLEGKRKRNNNMRWWRYEEEEEQRL